MHRSERRIKSFDRLRMSGRKGLAVSAIALATAGCSPHRANLQQKVKIYSKL
jgi:hypothetical protein